MSDYFRPSTQHVARCRGRCTYCGQHIERGMHYKRFTGNYDGRWFCHRMHLECAAELAAHANEGDHEFTPGDNDRPGDHAPTPSRVQLSRAKGWRMPANTIKVDRTTRYGNPFTPTMICVTPSKHYKPGEEIGVDGAVRAFRTSLQTMQHRRPDEYTALVDALRGKNLACWCKPGARCHADVLLELANEVRS